LKKLSPLNKRHLTFRIHTMRAQLNL
jgi:hypothetical protein